MIIILLRLKSSDLNYTLVYTVDRAHDGVTYTGVGYRVSKLHVVPQSSFVCVHGDNIIYHIQYFTLINYITGIMMYNIIQVHY